MGVEVTRLECQIQTLDNEELTHGRKVRIQKAV